MSMSGTGQRRQTCVVSARAFEWDRAITATLRHSSLSFDAPISGGSLADARDLGERDRLALLAQFAAHQALLQFAGIVDGDLDPAEWLVVRKRGCDARLIRVGARSCDPSV